MSRNNGKGALYSQRIVKLLEAIIPRIDKRGKKYWLIGGILKDILEQGRIEGPHGDIDFFILEEDGRAIVECLKDYMQIEKMNQNDRDNNAKLTYSCDGTKNKVNNSYNNGAYSIEFIFLKNCPDKPKFYYSDISTTGSNLKCFPKSYVGAGVIKHLPGMSIGLCVPSCSKKLLDIL